MGLPPNPDGSSSPLLFAIKCPSRLPAAPICKRVRVFSTLSIPGSQSVVSEISPILQSYPFVREMHEFGGAPRRVARFLIFACDLYMVGRLEADPESRDAAYVGAALQLRKAAELFLARCTMQVAGRIPRPAAMVRVMEQHIPPTVETLSARRRVRNAMRFILDTGDIQSHPEPEAARLHYKRYHRPATRGTIEKCLARFDDAAKLVRWDL